MKWAIELPVLNPTDKLVLLALAHCENDKTSQCNPSVAYLGLLTNLGERTIRRSIKTLEEWGCIKVTPTFTDDGQTSNSYTIIVKFDGGRAYCDGPSVPQRQTSPVTGADRTENIKENTEHRNQLPPRSRASAKVKEPEYEPWPDDNRPPNKDIEPKKRKPSSRSLAIDFQREVIVQFGALEVTNVYALSGNIKKWNTAGISFAEIQACIEYFFKVPSRYMWNDVRPWVAFVYKFKEIRKDCDWTDPNYKTTVKRFTPKRGSRGLTNNN